MTLHDIVDFHVHSEPDVRPRSCDDLALARAAKQVGARAVVIKSHHFFTADRATIAQAVVAGVQVFGGVTLNPSVGGLNPAAVDAALKIGARIVWLPTLFATNHRRWEGRSGGVPVVVDGAVLPAAKEIFEQVATADVVLAMGHQSVREIWLLVAEAVRCGVRKIVINHPEHAVVAMSISEQRALRSEFPVWFERCYAQPIGGGAYKTNFEENLRAIEEVGVESTLLATDAGQIENPPWAECWERMLEYYAGRGVGEEIWRRITAEHPAQLLGLPKIAAARAPSPRPDHR
jgi:hypothetical protein